MPARSWAATWRSSLLYREATPEQMAFMREQGQLVRWLDSRAMARPTKSDGRPTLVQLKAVEPAYPLYGTVELARWRHAGQRAWASATASGAPWSRNRRCAA